MSYKPIIFSAPMVRALLEGRKTQTRRIIKPQPSKPWGSAALDGSRFWTYESLTGEVIEEWRLPYAPGDRLYVRECFNAFQFSQDGEEAWPVDIPTLAECKEAEDIGHRFGAPQIVYKESDRARKWFSDQKWRPSIHMPRWASRLTLTVTDVRVQRLQEISEADARSEGVESLPDYWVREDAHIGGANGDFIPNQPPKAAFRDLWNSLHGPEAWDANPWVAAYSFTVQHGNIDMLAERAAQ